MAAFFVYLTLILCSYSELSTVSQTSDSADITASCFADVIDTNEFEQSNSFALSPAASLPSQARLRHTKVPAKLATSPHKAYRSSQTIRAPPLSRV